MFMSIIRPYQRTDMQMYSLGQQSQLSDGVHHLTLICISHVGCCCRCCYLLNGLRHTSNNVINGIHRLKCGMLHTGIEHTVICAYICDACDAALQRWLSGNGKKNVMHHASAMDERRRHEYHGCISIPNWQISQITRLPVGGRLLSSCELHS